MRPRDKTAPFTGLSITLRVFLVLFPLALFPTLFAGLLFIVLTRGQSSSSGLVSSNAGLLVLLLMSAILLAALLWWGIRITMKPVRELSEAAGNLNPASQTEFSAVERQDELGRIANQFNRMAEELSGFHRSLDLKVEERTRQIRIAAEIAQAAISVPDPVVITEQTVRMIVDRLGSYHAAIYLLEPGEKYVVLAKASGAGSEELIARGTRTAVGSNSIIGWVAASRLVRIASDLETDPLYSPNEFLPLARSEAGFPLSAQGELLGVLDVQSSTRDAFNPETAEALQILAGLIATELINARVLNSAVENLKKMSAVYEAGKSFSSAAAEADVNSILADALAVSALSSALYSADTDGFSLHSFHLASGEEFDRAPIEPPTHISAQVGSLEGGASGFQRIFILDTLAEDRRYQEFQDLAAALGWSSLAVLPLQVQGTIHSLLFIGARGRNQVTEGATASYVELVEGAGMAIQDLQVRQSARLQQENLAAVGDLIHELAGQNPAAAEDSLAKALVSLIEICGCDLGAIYLLDEEKSRFELKTSSGETDTRRFQSMIPIASHSPTSPGDNPAAWIQTVLSDSPAILTTVADDGISTITTFPIIYRGEVLGALLLERNRPASLPVDHEELVQAFCSALALALANSRLAHRQRLLFEVTARISRSAELGEVMQTTVQELGGILRARRASLQIGTGRSEESNGN